MLLDKQLGTVDPDTGNTLSYGYEGTLTLDGVDYYNYRVSWLVDGDHMSYLTNYLVSTDGQTVREYTPEEPADTGDAELESAADSLLSEMADGDFAAISEWVDEECGVTFTPYSTVNFDTDRTVTAEELAAFGTDKTVYSWGSYDGSGNPIALTDREYWDRFVWNTDYTAAPSVLVDEVAQTGNAPENAAEAYPDARFVEYHFDGLEEQYEGIDWCSLKLVFVSRGSAWKLAGIIHSEITT